MTPLDRIRAIAMEQPRAAEKLSHGMPVFFIDKGKTFAWYSENHHGNGITAVTNESGRVTIMMPHPERVFRTVSNSWHPAEWGEDSPWMRIFRNARKQLG